MSDEHEPLEVLDGRFRLDSEMIAGGMGTVYRGLDLHTNEPVAVKISASFGAQLGERFEQEANCLAEIAHPAIVRYVGHGRNSRREHYLAMEWLEGETLEDRLARGALSLADAFRVARRVAEALHAVHSRGIIHRDIKPANLFLPNKDLTKLKLLDFGIARRLFDAPAMRLTQLGSTIGTPMYMSPEQAQGLPDLDARADIFSLGCVVFECLLGNPPFLGDSSTATLLEIEQGHTGNVAGRLRGVSPKLAELVERMLAKDRKDRPANMGEILASLDKITQELRSTGTLPVVKDPGAHRPSLGGTAERRLAVALTILPGDDSSGAPRGARPGGAMDIAGLLCRGFSGGPMSDLECAALNPRLGALGAHLRRRPEGGYVALLLPDRPMSPGDLLANGALTALRLKGIQPRWAYALTMGHVARNDASLIDGLCAAGRRLVDAAKPGAIYLPPDLRRAAETRFEVATDSAERCRLLFEKSLRDAPPTVLGKEIPCVGRDREITGIEALFTECLEESTPQVMLVVGAAGAGKSRVAREFLDRIQHRGEPFGLLVGRGDPMRMDVPLGLLGEALRAAAGIATTMPEETQRKRLHAHVTRHVPPGKADLFSAFLGEIAGVPFPDDELPPLREARRDPRQMADQTQAYWVDWVELEAAHAPVVILFEDLHWGDRPSVAFVDAALRVLRDKPLFVLALGRPEMEQRLPGLWRDRHPQRASLVPLGERAMDTIIHTVLGGIAADQRAWLLERAQGNPFFLEELLRSFHANPSLTDIPDTLVGMVQARFDAVGEDCKGLLRAGAVFGQTFQASGVKYMTPEMDPDDVDRWLEILTQKEILFARAPGADGEFSFRHALHRDAAYALLGRDLKVLGHRLAGEFLETQQNPAAILVADHFERGQEYARAITWLRRAASQALEADDLPSVLARVEKAVRLGATGDELAELRIVESEAHFWQGSYAEAERAARAGRQCSDPNLALRATIALLDGLGPQLKVDEIALIAKQIEGQAVGVELEPNWFHCMLDIAAYLASAGDATIRKRVLALMEPKADALPAYLRGRMETIRGHILIQEGKLALAAPHFSRAQAIYEEAGYRRQMVEALGNLTSCLMDLGVLAEAGPLLERLWETVNRMGMRHMYCGTLNLLASCLGYQGRLPEAIARGEEALRIAQENNDAHWRGYIEWSLAELTYLTGDFSTATTHAEAAMATFRDKPPSLTNTQALLARVRLAGGDPTSAATLAHLAAEGLERLGVADGGEALVHLALAECLEAQGDRVGATAALAKALAIVADKANALEDLEWRDSFWRNIPTHRRIRHLAKDWGLLER